MPANEEGERGRDQWAFAKPGGKEGKLGTGPFREGKPGTSGPTKDQSHMRNNGPREEQGPSAKYGSSEKYDRASERQKVIRLKEGLEVCPHSGAGCTWRGTCKTELSRHLATQVEAHLALVTQECRRQAEEIDRLRGKLEEASVGREVGIFIIIILLLFLLIITVMIIITIMNMIMTMKNLNTRVCLYGELVEWKLV